MKNIYLVKWPDGSYSVAIAENPYELYELLDEQGNPRDCEWKELDMNLLFDVEISQLAEDENDDGDDEAFTIYTLVGVGEDWDALIEEIIEEPFENKFLLTEEDIPELDRMPISGVAFGIFTNPKDIDNE